MAPLKIASTLLFAAVVLLSVSFIDAKITSVSGDVVIMGTNSVPLPENVYNEPTNGFHDASSPIVNGELQIGIFEEKTAVKPPNDITIAGGVKLSKNKFYDSFFFFFHQATPNVNAESATGKVFFDNALVGCTSSNGEFNDGAKDIETFPIFGLDLPNFYPTTTTPARGLEGGDFATTSTELSIQVTIVQPGDYARCFTETCPPAGCTCSATPNTACLAGTGAAQCFPSVASLVDFSSSCDEVTAASAKYTVAGCDGTNGCTIKPDGSICFDDDTKTYSLSVSGSGGCGCQISAFDLTLSPCCKYATIVNDEGFVSSKGKCACLQG